MKYKIGDKFAHKYFDEEEVIEIIRFHGMSEYLASAEDGSREYISEHSLDEFYVQI